MATSTTGNNPARDVIAAWDRIVTENRVSLAGYEQMDEAIEAMRREVEAGMVMVPRKPNVGLLVSIAMRLDHSFGMRMPRLFGKEVVTETDDEWYQRQRCLIADAGRAYEEIVGDGSYAPEHEQWYIGHLAPEWQITGDAALAEAK